jgi:hypothetical protein
MDDNVKQELLSLGAQYFNGLKSVWTGDDLQKIYNMYNQIKGTNKLDTGCNSCRRAVINETRDFYMDLVKNKSLQ